MDNNIVYTVDTPNFRVICSCSCQYFYKTNERRPFRQIITGELRTYTQGYCASCKGSMNLYDTDLLTEIGRIEWITI